MATQNSGKKALPRYLAEMEEENRQEGKKRAASSAGI
jgi:hypothetical protein